MELQTIVDRYAEAITVIDDSVEEFGANARTGAAYSPGFRSLNEARAVELIDDTWTALHPDELLAHGTSIRYQTLPSSAKCDHVISTVDDPDQDLEWGIEVKRLQFVGDNGKANDYAVTKTLSPYLKDRGLLHDALRLREHGFTKRVAVVAYLFNYSTASVSEGFRRHRSDQARTVLANIAEVLERNGGSMQARPLVEFLDAIMGLRGLSTGPRAEAPFSAWRHPAGGEGLVFGWEIRRPHLEPGYDPRHPW